MALICFAILLTSLPAATFEARTIGLRLILPFTRIRHSIGAELIVETEFGRVSLSLFISSAAGTLVLGSADIAMTEDPSEAASFLRLTTGFSYFDSSRLLPSLVAGAGMALRYSPLESIEFGLSAEALYPLAFPVPMISLSGGWVLP